MLLEELIIDISSHKNSLKVINDYLIGLIMDGDCRDFDKEMYDKSMGLLHASSSLIESMEKILAYYQEEVERYYARGIKEQEV